MNDSFEVRQIRTAVVVAGHSGDVDFVRAHLDHTAASVRSSALTALERLQVLDSETLRSFLADPDPLVRRRVAELAARHFDVDLIELLDDSDPLVVEMAAWACGEQMQERSDESISDQVDRSDDVAVRHPLSRRPDDSTIDKLTKIATSHDDPLVREAAVAALGAIGDERGLQAILAGCEDKPAIRRRAVLALAPFAGERVDAALHRALEDRDWQVRQAAEDVLGPTSASGRRSFDDQQDSEENEEN